jgi:hypothetical protein
MWNRSTLSVTGVSRKPWLVTDAVDALREWGTSLEHALPTSEHARVTIGREPPAGAALVTPVFAATRTALRFDRPSVSRQHAVMTRDGVAWVIKDLGSYNGVRIDGQPTTDGRVLPGHVISLGAVQLIAVSARIRAMHRLWTRYLTCLGDVESLARVDAALWSTRRLVDPQVGCVVLRGSVSDQLVHRVHDLTRGSSRPLVIAPSPDRVLGAAELVALFERAQSGTLLLRERYLGAEAQAALRQALGGPIRSSARVIVAAAAGSDLSRAFGALGRPPVIDVPCLDTRGAEAPLLVREVVRDATVAVGAPSGLVRECSVEWLRSRRWDDYEDLEAAAFRIAALRQYPNLATAASAVGLTRQGLDKWVKEYAPPL